MELTAGRREQTLNCDRLGNENELPIHAARNFNKIPSDIDSLKISRSV
jgi:hypothetical protein